MKIRTYSELIRFDTFDERLNYLALASSMGVVTFGIDRYLNQEFYNSYLWKSSRQKVIIRDNACDLGLPGFEIFDAIRVHHMNPITIEDIERGDESIFDPEFLICTSLSTHNLIHFGGVSSKPRFIERRKGDTKLW